MVETTFIEQVRPEVLRRLRHRVLHRGQAFESAVYPIDSLVSAQHFAAWYNNKVVGAASIYQADLPETVGETSKSWRLIGLAVDGDFDSVVVARLLVDACSDFVRRFDAHCLWCAVTPDELDFYRSLNFEIVFAETTGAACLYLARRAGGL